MRTRPPRRSAIKSFVDLACGSFGAVMLLAVTLLRLNSDSSGQDRTEARVLATAHVPAALLQDSKRFQVECLLDGRNLISAETDDNGRWQFLAEDHGARFLIEVRLDPDAEHVLLDFQAAKLRAFHRCAVRVTSHVVLPGQSPDGSQESFWQNQVEVLADGSAFAVPVRDECERIGVIRGIPRDTNDTLQFEIRLNSAQQHLADVISLQLEDQ